MNQHISRVVEHPMTPPILVGVLSGAMAFGAGFLLGKKHGPMKVITVTVPTPVVEDDKPKVHPNQMTLDDIESLPDLQEGNGIGVINGPMTIHSISLDPTGGLPGTSIEVVDYTDPEEQKAVRATEEENFIGHDEGLGWDDVPQAVLSPDEPEDEAPFEVEETINRNVFANSGEDDGWVLEEQISLRATLDTDQPYPIHRDEFASNESGYHQNECVYYAGDDIMTDSNSVPLYNYRDIVGELKFGFGSGDPNVVYVRNDDLGNEYEILKHHGMYSTEVLGLEIEDNLRAKDLRHSKQPRKMRNEE